ncbi:MAG: hypothetical protein JWN30_1353 [Bacilli bacterium]|nr:hypothetical protein [Bacilli bacterium]
MREAGSRFKEGFKWKTSLLLVSAILGFAITIQYAGAHQIKPVLSTDSLELKTQLSAELDHSQQLDKQLIDLQNQIDQYKKSSGDAQSMQKQIADQMHSVLTDAAFTTLTGPGITIQIQRDSALMNRVILTGGDPSVHDEDLRLLQAVLFASGAQGIAINNYRISSFSTIRAIGAGPNPQIEVNGHMVADPYVIKVVGDADTLKAGLINNQIENIFHTFAYDVIIQTASANQPVTLPAYNEPMEIRYAKVDTQGAKK